MVQKIYIAIMVQVIVALLLFYFLPISHASPSMEIVTTSFGQLRGKHLLTDEKKAYTQFLGIPYAQPPLGHLRFAIPRPYSGDSWKYPRDATKSSAPCVQGLGNFNYGSSRLRKIAGKEDCLVLNVYVPDECRGEFAIKCPVMVWIHPGGFSILDASPRSYSPELWMNNRVVLVAPNYRLGVLGFLSFDNDLAPGNLGLRDQQLALEWIQKEISNFGGDPESVTIFGSGAGGYSTILQMLSPLNKDKKLFHRIISQSGSPIMDRFLRFPKSRRSYALELASSLSCDTSVEDEKIMNCLRLQSPEQLQIQARIFAENMDIRIPNPFVPKIDDHDLKYPFLKDYPENIIVSGNFEKVPVIIGSNTDEGMQQISMFIEHPLKYKNFTESLPMLLFNKLDKDMKKEDYELINFIKKSYLTNVENSDYQLRMKHAARMFTDLDFQGKIGKTVQLLEKHSDQNVYLYVYKYLGTHTFADFSAYKGWKLRFKHLLQSFGFGYNMRSGYGIAHGDELFQMFRMKRLPNPMSLGPLADNDKKLSKNLITSWTNFAKFGNPSVHQNKKQKAFQWFPTTSPDFKFNIMKSDFQMTLDPLYWKRVLFFEKVMEKLNDKPLTNPTKVIRDPVKKIVKNKPIKSEL